MPINFPSSPNTNDTYTSGGTTWIYSGSIWNVVASSSQVVVNATNSFNTIAVSGQSPVVADSDQDTLTLVAGTNITITTDAASDAITINSTASGGGGGGNSFTTIAVSGQSNVVADSSTDTLTLAGSGSTTITTDATTDTITISSTGVSTFAALTEVAAASLPIDQIYLPAITMLTVSNSGATAYLFDQYSGNNPTVYAIGGTTIAFKLQCAGHPFLIQDGTATNYNTGLYHVSSGGVVSTGSNAQGQSSGTLYWKVPASISGTYRYQCSLHAPMVGAISVKNIVSV